MEVAVVVGAGPGLGGAVARRFAHEGLAVALLARTADKVATLAERIAGEGGRALALAVDAADPEAVRAGFDRVRADLGAPSVLVYNASAFTMGGVVDLTPEQFEAAWRGSCFGAFLAAKQVLPDMLAAGRGTILLTGATAALRGGGRFAAFAVGKFGLRALGQSMAREYGPRGIHVAHVIVDGQIDGPSARTWSPEREAHTMLQPDALADVYWQLHRQHPTTWTQELDLRPAVEKF